LRVEADMSMVNSSRPEWWHHVALEPLLKTCCRFRDARQQGSWIRLLYIPRLQARPGRAEPCPVPTHEQLRRMRSAVHMTIGEAAVSSTN
jgi:hypothetical protein